jgi:hypothetical protein
MSFLLIIAPLAFADSSYSLPDPLLKLAKSADTFAASVAKLDKETHAVVADAALVHNTASNKTTRDAVLAYMGDRFEAGLPSPRPCEEAEKEAATAAAAYEKEALGCKAARAELAVFRERIGKANHTAKEEAELHRLTKVSLLADEGCAKAKAELERKVDAADTESAALLDATRTYGRTFLEHVDELMHAARSREAAAKESMGAATSEGQEAARAAMKSRELDERQGERDELKAEMWSEGHERAIEHASDHASDDLERIYAPVKHLVRKTLETAEHQAAERGTRLDRLANRDDVELVQLDKEDKDENTKPLPPGAPAWLPWAAGLALAVLHPLIKHCCCCKHRAAVKASAAAGSALLGGALQQPLLAEERI